MFSKSNSVFQATRSGRFLILAALVGCSFALATPAAYAGESGLAGWVFCTTYAPYSSAYVAGDPVYASEVFHVGSQTKDVGLLWRNFLKQKYGWTRSAGCSIATATTGQADQLRDSAQFTQQAGPKLVRTGWKGPASGITTPAPTPAPLTPPQPAAANPSAPVQGSFMAGGIMYWVCDWFNTPSAVYISDVFSASNKLGPTELVPAFQKFVSSKYPVNPHAGSTSCYYRMKEADAQVFLQQRIAKPPSGMHVVQTGWKYGDAASGVATPAAAPSSPAAATAPASAPAPVESAPAPPATVNITVRLADMVNSASDPTGKKYSALVTQGVTAGTVQIMRNTLATITLAQTSPGQWTAQLVSLKVNGQDVAVTSTAVQAASGVQQAAQKLGGLLSGFGHKSTNQAAQSVTAAGNKVMLPPGTSLTFTTSVPQPSAPAPVANPAAIPASPPPAPLQGTAGTAPAGQPHGEIGPGGVVIGGSESGVPTAYGCGLEYRFLNAKHQTNFVSGPFISDQPRLWIMLWWSEYIHQTYNIPQKVNLITVTCDLLKGTQAQQQAVINKSVELMKMQNHDVVQVNWTPGDKKPEPGISVSQLNTAEGSIIRLDDNLPPVTHPAGSKVLCITNNGGDGRAFVSAIFLPGNLDARVFEAAFNKYLAINYGQHAPPNCLISAEVNGVEGVLFSARNEAPGNGIKLIETGWKYNGPGAASGSVPSGNQGVCNPHMGCYGSSHPAAANAVPPIAQGPSENRQANQLQSQ